VFYIIKENRTYDQVLGDMKEWKWWQFSSILATHYSQPHKLAREFVLWIILWDASKRRWDYTGAQSYRYRWFRKKTRPTSCGGLWVYMMPRGPEDNNPKRRLYLGLLAIQNKLSHPVANLPIYHSIISRFLTHTSLPLNVRDTNKVLPMA